MEPSLYGVNEVRVMSEKSFPGGDNSETKAIGGSAWCAPGPARSPVWQEQSMGRAGRSGRGEARG